MPASRASSSATPTPWIGLPKPHIIRQDRSPGAHRERDTIELVGEDLLFQQPRPERVGFRIAPDVSNHRGDALLQEPSLDVLLRIGVHRYGDAVRFDSPDAFEQVRHIGDRLVADRAYDDAGHLIEAGGSRMRSTRSLP